MKRIVCFDLGRRGGSVRYADLMIRELPFPEVHHFVSRSRQEPLLSGSGVRVHRIPTYRNSLEFVLASVAVLPVLLLALTVLRLRGARAVYSPYFHYWNLAIFICARALRMQVVATVHDGIPHLGDGKPGERILNKCCCRLATKVVFLTEFVRDLLVEEQWIRPGQPVRVIPHGIIAPEGLRREARRHPSREARQFKLLFFGRVSLYKGIDTLFEAYDALPEENASLSVIGKWQMSQRDVPLPKKQVVIRNDYVDEAGLVDALNSHDAIVLPYKEATQSGVLTLAIAARLPAIVTDVGGLAEQVTDGHSALITSPEPVHLARAMQRLIEDTALYEEMSAHLAELECGRFKWSRLASELGAFIRLSG